MKNALKIVAVALMLFVAPTIGKSQKMAHFSLDSLLEIMPEFKAASDSAQLYYKMLENQMVVMQMELDRKLGEYDSLSKMWSPLIKQLKEKEITDLQNNIQAFQMSAQQDFNNKRVQLVEPLYNKINKAAADVAKEKGYKYVIDSSKSAGVVIYADPADDILDAVRIKLGIPKPAPKPATPAPGK